MTIAILGAHGMLGYALREQFPKALLFDFETSADIDFIDITKPESLEERLKGFGNGDLVINAAAYTDVDGCETPEGRLKSEHVNALGPLHLATRSGKQGFRVLHVSTAYVFDGKQGNYDERSVARPINTYGEHKFAAEGPIRTSGGIVVRTDALYGPSGGNFVDSMIEIGRKESEIEVVSDQIGSPTYTRDLKWMIKVLLEDGKPGKIYHCTNRGSCSRADFSRKIMEFAFDEHERPSIVNISTTEYNKQHRSDIPTAIRPADSSFDTSRMSHIATPRPWDMALREYIRQLQL